MHACARARACVCSKHFSTKTTKCKIMYAYTICEIGFKRRFLYTFLVVNNWFFISVPHYGFPGLRGLSFCVNTNTGQICEDFNSIVGLSVWYDTFQIKNSEWFWFVSDIVANINSSKILCGSFALYPSYAAGILNATIKIYFYMLCYEQLNYEDYIKKCIASKDCCVSYKTHTGCYFKLSSGG